MVSGSQFEQWNSIFSGCFYLRRLVDIEYRSSGRQLTLGFYLVAEFTSISTGNGATLD